MDTVYNRSDAAPAEPVRLDDRPVTADETRARKITILGATGSIGRSTLDLVQGAPDRFEVVALTANSNAEGLIAAARAVRPKLVVIADPSRYSAVREGLAGLGIEVATGDEAVVEAARLPADWVMAGIVGAAGLRATLAALEAGRIVAFANKECLVSAGPIMLDVARRSGATLVPVDSEHNAIFQVFNTHQRERIRRLILTASGGPFREVTLDTMSRVTPREAIAHPTWSMGAKISVDSATMMNKGLEIVEAAYLFDMDESVIDVLVHPEAIIHSMVEYSDGSTLAQMGTPDMRTPIAYALAYPDRMDGPAERLDLPAVGGLSFFAPDGDRFPALQLCRRALQTGGAAPTILNAANEEAVAGFLDERIGFLDIVRVVSDTLDALPNGAVEDLDAVFDNDARARRYARTLIAGG